MVAGLIERRHPGQEKSGRQITVNSDLIYDVLRKHEPDHVLLRATRRRGRGRADRRAPPRRPAGPRQGRIVHRALDRVSPLAVPVLIEIGKESVAGGADEALLAEAAATGRGGDRWRRGLRRLLADVTEGIRAAPACATSRATAPVTSRATAASSAARPKSVTGA